MKTAATGGTVTLSSGTTAVSLEEVWRWEWARAWSDIGELAQRLRDHSPLFVHSPALAAPSCMCFDCRAARAIAQACER